MNCKDNLRDYKVPCPKSMSELMRFIKDCKQMYSVYAASIAATATYNYMCAAMQLTGFQANQASFDIFRRTQRLDGPLKILEYRNMLYPQYAYQFKNVIDGETWKWIQEEAAKRIHKFRAVSSVRNHWKRIVDGKVPFRYKVNHEL